MDAVIPSCRCGRPVVKYKTAGLCYSCYQVEWQKKNIGIEGWRKIRRDHLDRVRVSVRKSKRKLKLDVIAMYGGKCTCCDESHMEFMTIDHVNGGGTKHRKSMGGNDQFYRWLRNQKIAVDDFRLLCMNCNLAYGMFGYCPHNKKRQ